MRDNKIGDVWKIIIAIKKDKLSSLLYFGQIKYLFIIIFKNIEIKIDKKYPKKYKL